MNVSKIKFKANSIGIRRAKASTMCLFVKYALGEQLPSIKEREPGHLQVSVVSTVEKRRCLDVLIADGQSAAEADLPVGSALLSL